MGQYLFIPDVILSRRRCIDYNYSPLNSPVLKWSAKFRATWCVCHSPDFVSRRIIYANFFQRVRTRSPLSLGEQSSREISSNANQFELTGSEWTSWPPLKFAEAGGLLERTIRSGENTFSASRPSPIDSVIDHRREGVESKKAINEDVRAVSLTKHTPVYVNAGHGVNSNEIHREWTFLKLNDARTRTHTYTRARARE